MSNTLPIACSLEGRAFADRQRLIAEVGRDGLLVAERTGARARLEFRPSVDARLRELVAAEQQCCAFLDFALSVRDQILVLDIKGAPESAEALADLVGAFSRSELRRES